MEPKTLEEINNYIDNVIEDNNFIDVYNILVFLGNSDISFKEKTEILRRVDTYNKKIIRMFENGNKTLSEQVDDDYDEPINYNNTLPEVINKSTISEPTIIKSPNIKTHIQQLLLLSSTEEFENYLKSSISKINFNETINLLIANVLESIITIKKLITEDLLASGKRCELFNQELEKLNSILSVLYRMQYYSDEKEENRKNKIIYLITEAGNISISNDLKAIPIEFYDSIYNLLSSIQNGTFKEFKRIGTQTNNFKTNLLQVRENFTRIIFDQLSEDLYIILTVFIKKVSTSKEYFNNLRNVDTLLSRQLPYLNKQLKNNKDEFLSLNDSITEALFQKLLTKDRGEDFYGKINVKY